jgi:hypothetical protein
VLVASAVLLVASCDPSWVVRSDVDPVTIEDNGIAHVVLTPDGDDSYLYARSGPDLRVSADPSNAAGNLRTVFWRASAPSVTDGQSCATWTAQTEGRNVQQGAALRVSTDDAGVTRAVTVTKNIYMRFNAMFNFHVWDTGTFPQSTRVGRVDMAAAVANKPFPWHLCARTTGAVLTMKVWAGDGPEPEWGDASHSASVTLPPEWVYPGTTGWYIGHVPPDGFAAFTDLESST